jgi:hypothetical protein
MARFCVADIVRIEKLVSLRRYRRIDFKFGTPEVAP